MKASSWMKINGVYYQPGEDIPESKVIEEPKKVEEKVEKAVEETVETVKYTKNDIMRMSTQNLKALAVSEGIENAEEMTGKELKTVLVDKLSL